MAPALRHGDDDGGVEDIHRHIKAATTARRFEASSSLRSFSYTYTVAAAAAATTATGGGGFLPDSDLGGVISRNQ